MSPAEQSTKYWELCVISACGILICLFFTIFCRWLYWYGKIQYTQWDALTLTAADYTVEMRIKEKSYKDWYQTEYKNGDFKNEIAPLMSLKKYMIRKIEERLTKDLEEAHRDPVTEA
jgi:hypothetical protein